MMGKTPAEYDVEHWRGEFEKLYEKLPKRGLARQLSKFDDYFGTTEGYFSVKNVRNGKGSISTTKRVVAAMEKLIQKRSANKNRINRQKLQSVK
ncbi:hypothetical protein [Jiulongibacter sp. NS-SX5]|uniref:hypothetical protein n=1 Tax=Jiulongibacter sp. NS-SX5 TaxID=3463854 RepID=UPI00405A487C